MKRSALIQTRLQGAVSALQRAGAEGLPGMLLDAFDGDSIGEIGRALEAARAWAYIDLMEHAGEPLAKERRFARDQIGLLWAVAEGLTRGGTGTC
jgi:hypothetical protein